MIPQAAILATIASSELPSGGGGATYFGTTTFEGAVQNPGRYDGYSFVHQHSNGMLSDLYMSRLNHFDTGPLMLAFSFDGGNAWPTMQIRVDGVLTVAVALWKCVTSTGRMLIAYQDTTSYQYVKFAYSDNPTSRNFTYTQTWDFGSSWVSSPATCAGVIMPEGQIRFYYYKLGGYPVPVPGDPYIVGALETSDNGLTYVDNGEEIWNHTAQAPDDFGNWKCHETSVVITHPGVTNATTKMIAWSRVNFPDESSTYYMVARSADGGATWTTDFTEDTGSFVDDNGITQGGPFSRHLNYTFLAGNNPVWLIAHQGFIYCVNGERNAAGGYKLKYSTATPDGAYRNKWDDWARPTLLRAYNAPGGHSINCGYVCPYENKISADDLVPQLCYHDYDETPTSDGSVTWVYQGIIDPL